MEMEIGKLKKRTNDALGLGDPLMKFSRGGW